MTTPYDCDCDCCRKAREHRDEARAALKEACGLLRLRNAVGGDALREMVDAFLARHDGEHGGGA